LRHPKLLRKEYERRLAAPSEKFQEQLSELESESREQAVLREALACLDEFTSSISANLKAADWALRREVLRTLIDRILIEEDQLRIVYRINFPLFAKKSSKAGKEKVLHFCWWSGFSSVGKHLPASCV